MDKAQREALIDQYENGYQMLMAALEGITDAELEARAEPGGWRLREIVHHLADGELVGAVRLRQLVAEETPRLAAYDQEAFVRRLYPDRPIEPSLAAIAAARAATAPILRRLREAEWRRFGMHSVSGPHTVADWLRVYVDHAEEHADQIRRARATNAAAALN